MDKLRIENEDLSRQNTQLSLQTVEYERLVEKLQNKINSLEVELDYKTKRSARAEDIDDALGTTLRDYKRDISVKPYPESERSVSPFKSSSRTHPLVNRASTEYKPFGVKAHLNFGKISWY